MELKTRQDVEDFVRGCTLFGTGGGGTPDSGIASLVSELESGNSIGWVDINQVPDDATVVCPYLMGSIAPHTDEVKKKMQFLGLEKPLLTEKEQLVKAVKVLSNYRDVEIDYIVPIELGGANTPGPLAVASFIGKLCIDGDYTGRAIPEIPQTTPYIFEKDMWPIASTDKWGNVCLIDEACNYHMAERIGKHIAAAAFGLVGQAGFLLTGKDVKEIIVPNTLTECYELGKCIREARENNNDPVKAAIDYLNGWVLFTGEVTGKDWEDKDGYYWGTHTITGDGKFKGDTFKIWFKNENHISWYNDKPYVTSPDMIIVVNLEDGEPYANPSLAVGHKVAVLGVRKREEFDNKRGIEVLGPRHFGFDLDHKPIETIVK
ncbi:MAG: DUF917 domain-containing protein [Firmicutes bacterium]|nr:DUF917 domain-containing protein [Bacillota bacterium]